MASKKSTWGKSANWNAPKRGAKKSAWGTPADVARVVGKRSTSKRSTGKVGKLRKFLGPLF